MERSCPPEWGKKIVKIIPSSKPRATGLNVVNLLPIYFFIQC